MKKIFSKRVLSNDYENRFAPFTACKSAVSKILNFGIGQDTDLVDEEIQILLKKSFDEKTNYGYSEAECPELKTSFQRYAFKHYGTELTPSELTISMGIKDSLNMLAYLLINPNDLVITTSPGYPVFERAARNYGARILKVDLTPENNFCPDIASWLQDQNLKPKIVEINYPNNPTGRSISYSELAKIKSYLDSYGGILINDAAYLDYSYRHPPVSLLALGTHRSIELYSASKTFGLTGLRVGITAGDPSIIAKLELIRDQFNSGQASPFMTLYSYLLAHRDIRSNLAKYKTRYQRLADVLKRNDFAVSDLDSTFYLFVPVPNYLHRLGETALEIATVLKKDYGIIFIPYSIDSKAYFRISLTYKEDRDVDVLDQRLKSLRGQ